ncbi:MAG: hypothetical protein ABI693_03570 [Bryobacteraceae bacterium]
MHRPTRAPCFLVLMLVVGLSAGVEAGFLKIWQLKETGARIPDGTLPWKAETLRMTAEVQVLRWYANSGESIGVERLRLRFLKYGGSVTAFINGYPPPLPDIEPGGAVVLPLQAKMDAASRAWDLIEDSGVHLWWLPKVFRGLVSQTS